MSDIDNHSRFNKFDKRRKNTKYISVLIIAGSILLIILLGIWIFGGKDKNTDNQDNDSTEIEITENEEASEKDDESVEDDGTSADDNEPEENESEDATDEEEDEEKEEEEIETEQVEPSDDNVAEAYTGNWEPVGTEQEGPHTTDYTDGSKDRTEIQKAVVQATKLNEDDMRTLWVGNGGDQKVIVTVSNSNKTENYRVYLSWIDRQGWQTTKVEVLKESEY